MQYNVQCAKQTQKKIKWEQKNESKEKGKSKAKKPLKFSQTALLLVNNQYPTSRNPIFGLQFELGLKWNIRKISGLLLLKSIFIIRLT